MGVQPFTYLTFHRVRFPAPISSHTRSFAGPHSAARWLFGTDSRQGEDGVRTRVSHVWGGAAFYSDLREAENVMDNLATSLPFLSETVEAWHALICPISHRGEVNWFGSLEAASQFAPVRDDPGGPLVVLTSAGFNSLPPEELKADMPRRIDFLANVDRIKAWFATQPNNVIRGVYQVGPVGTDGMTFSIWKSDAAMAETIYRPGVHRAQLDRYKAELTADRTSFTRARILRCVGTWDGAALI